MAQRHSPAQLGSALMGVWGQAVVKLGECADNKRKRQLTLRASRTHCGAVSQRGGSVGNAVRPAACVDGWGQLSRTGYAQWRLPQDIPLERTLRTGGLL